MAVAMFTSAPAMADQPAVPVPRLDPPAKVVSLHRPRDDWKVVTTITLAIEPSTGPWERTFRWSDPVHGQLKCLDLPEATHVATVPSGVTSIACTYQPHVGFVGSDRFTYDARFEGGAFSEQATVAIDVRERGLRWEFRTSASTITSDAPDPEALAQIPSILGGTSQDFLFTVNWQLLRPRQRLADGQLARTSGLLRGADLRMRPGAASRSANFVIETGIESSAVAATLIDVGQAATPMGSTAAGADSPTEQAVARRTMVLRGEFNYNAGINADGIGRFVEVGGVGKGAFTTVLDSDESFKEAVGRVFQVVPLDRTACSLDVGMRLAVKQAHELSSTTLVNPSGQTEQPTNIENAFVLEVLWRFDTSVSNLATDSTDGDSRRRWAIRAEFSPEIDRLPGHQRPTIGFEVSRAWDGGPPSVKITYGVNLSATKGIFKN